MKNPMGVLRRSREMLHESQAVEEQLPADEWERRAIALTHQITEMVNAGEPSAAEALDALIEAHTLLQDSVSTLTADATTQANMKRSRERFLSTLASFISEAKATVSQ